VVETVAVEVGNGDLAEMTKVTIRGGLKGLVIAMAIAGVDRRKGRARTTFQPLCAVTVQMARKVKTDNLLATAIVEMIKTRRAKRIMVLWARRVKVGTILKSRSGSTKTEIETGAGRIGLQRRMTIRLASGTEIVAGMIAIGRIARATATGSAMLCTVESLRMWWQAGSC